MWDAALIVMPRPLTHPFEEMSVKESRPSRSRLLRRVSDINAILHSSIRIALWPSQQITNAPLVLLYL
eukprot:1140681-Amphidinium_carterae.1